MRETCARVLAAALMTGAIATAMGLPTTLESAGEPRAALVSPPSSRERSVPFVAVPASKAKRPARAERRVAVRTPRPAFIRHAVVSRNAPAATARPKPAPARPPATTPPATPPAPVREPERELAAAPPATEQPQPAAVAPPAPPPVAAEPPATEEPPGHAYGHDKHDEKDKDKKDKRKD